MSVDQGAVFAAFEGDAWFRRNAAALVDFNPVADLPLRLLDLYGIRPTAVVEVGAANGYRVAELRRRTGARAVAVEVSEEAIRDGIARHPEVEFVRAAAVSVPLRGPFDLVIVNFVFHWVDRLSLLRAAGEIDRLCGTGGFLLIGDFFPANRMRAPYHHARELSIFTYKQDYAALFLSSGVYGLVATLTADHATHTLRPDVPDGDRIGTWLLRKEPDARYADGAFSIAHTRSDP